MTTVPPPGSSREVFAVALRLGLTSFGGPIAHIGYFRREYVQRRGWLDEATFADLVALGQSLPGPTSSQVGFAIGILRAGLAGGLAAWLAFTLPSALIMLGVAALGVAAAGEAAPLVAGLKLAAVPIVAHAVLSMARTLTPDLPRALVALAAAAVALAVHTAFTQLAMIVAGGLIGLAVLGPGSAPPAEDPRAATAEHAAVGRRAATLAVAALVGLLAVLPALALASNADIVEAIWGYVRAGALVFGGGHVVLPLLEASVVAPGWVSQDAFLAGYGAAQAVPGPLFTFAAYLGAIQEVGPGGVVGASLALVSLFMPGLLLVVAILPSWSTLRARPGARAALRGVNAAVVGILLAALWDPVARSAITGPPALIVAVAGLVLMLTGRVPPILVVGGCALAGLVGLV